MGTQYKDAQIVRWSNTAKPTVGGISFFITFILSALVYLLTANNLGTPFGDFLALVIVVSVGFILGLSDDAYNTKPLLKFLTQVSCGVIMIAFGIYIELFGIPALDYVLTVFWVVGIMNSINLLDNMDGVTATVSLTIFLIAVIRIIFFPGGMDFNPYLFTLVATCGALIGFLFLNWNPSKIFMGDTGSQFLGALLAMIGVKFFWNFEINGEMTDPISRVIIPVIVFMVPIMDTTFVTFARIMRGSSPFVGGKDHLTHHMSYLGIPQARIPLILGLFSFGSGIMLLFCVRYFFPWQGVYEMVLICYFVLAFGIFFYLFKRGEKIGYIRNRFSKTLNRYFEEKKKAGISQKQAKQHS